MGKVVTSWKELVNDLAPLRKQGRIVFTNGCFDILHLGHVRYLQEAKAQGTVLVLGLNTDASVQKLNGPSRPLQSENDRAEILASLKAVDHTILFGEETPLELIKEVKPNLLVKGGDWKPEQIIGSDYVASIGGVTKSLMFKSGYSTSNLIKAVQGKK